MCDLSVLILLAGAELTLSAVPIWLLSECVYDYSLGRVQFTISEDTLKKIRSIGHASLLICLAIAGLACTRASNTTSNANPQAQPTATAPTTTTTTGSSSVADSNAPPIVEEVDVYLVAVGDNGKKGIKIGCDDSLVGIQRKIKPTVAPLRAAIEELLSIPREYSKELGNYWQGKDLKLKDVKIAEGVATIHITGEGPFVGGICDEPRITEQMEKTAMQFSSVNSVKVFVNDKPLAEAIR
jgi:hypothetical protein